MPSKITNEQIDASFDVAKQVYRGELTASAGATQLAREHGININSATALIRDYRHLRNGECYRRTLSTPAADVFLHRIFTEDGAEALASAIAAVWAHIAYYERTRKTTVHALRNVVSRHEEQLRRRRESTTLAQICARFEREIATALSDTAEARRRRLALAPRKPATITVTTEVFVRNPDVVAEVLDRADGKCEICHSDAPFLRRDGRPYLEVHHVVQLADGGDDTTENAVAVCPNCHRRAHYSTPARK
ncbi:HNH endonuclease [Ralstonia solanacearum]|jgi:5-methylcytosine-specific restriction protein A|uniref:HNH endonuclease n=1 Tax=Ralstonia solanacearum TaxID=305 RepID=A0AAW5ZUH4_RALSL|nr:HNH endonuclease signature motif containing protein [Ralstonia solanacearum]MDB0574060.1 HNH endonuclease [Ralstonia solanacearum]